MKLVFRATQYTGCDALAFRDAVNRKLRESKFFYVVNPAVTVRGTSTTLTDNTRDEFFTEALVIMGVTYPSTPTYGEILKDYQNFIGGAWSCWGTSGGIRLVDANVAAYESPPQIHDSREAVSDSNNNRPKTPQDETISALKFISVAVIAVGGAYVISKLSVFFPNKKG